MNRRETVATLRALAESHRQTHAMLTRQFGSTDEPIVLELLVYSAKLAEALDAGAEALAADLSTADGLCPLCKMPCSPQRH